MRLTKSTKITSKTLEVRFYRQSPPEYRALVVENEREFRNDLIYTVESLDIGISVVAEAADYEDALLALAAEKIDLLITDINLTDGPRFEVGVEDGTALAKHARDRYNIPAIFLTAFADYDPAVVTRATQSDPIGFIQKNGAEVNTRIQQLISLALRRLELTRNEEETRLQMQTILEQMGDVLLYIGPDGFVIDFNERACELLEYSPDELIDQHWEDIVRVDALDSQGFERLQKLVDQRRNARLPCIALQAREGGSILCSLQLITVEHRRELCSLMMLRDLRHDLQHNQDFVLDAGSSLLMVGLRCPDLDVAFNTTQLRLMMLNLQALLLSNVRVGDVVLKPQNSNLGVVLPRTDEGTAYVVSRALIETVGKELRRQIPSVELRGGLAYRNQHHSDNAALASAIDALDHAQHGSDMVVLAATGSFTAREVSPAPQSLADSPGSSTKPNRLEFGFRIAARVLDIAPDSISGLESLLAQIKRATAEESTIEAYGLGLCPAGQDRDWTWKEISLSRDHTAADDAPDLDEITAGLLSELIVAGDELQFLVHNDMQFILVPLHHQGERLGALLCVRKHIDGSAKDPVSKPEQRLGVVIGDYLGMLTAQALRYDASSNESNRQDTAYSLYEINSGLPQRWELDTLLQLDAPVALVGEAGSARAELLAYAVKNCGLNEVSGMVVQSGEDWSDPNRGAELATMLSSCAHQTLLLREPCKMHPELQEQFAWAIQTRSIVGERGEQHLPPMRFAITLPKKPASMIGIGQLHPSLASAFGAGVVVLAPLRERSDELMDWAEKILVVESKLQHKHSLRLTTEAKQALAKHSWPGNLVELQDRLSEAVTRARGDCITELDLGLFRLHSVIPGGDGVHSPDDSNRRR